MDMAPSKSMSMPPVPVSMFKTVALIAFPIVMVFVAAPVPMLMDSASASLPMLMASTSPELSVRAEPSWVVIPPFASIAPSAVIVELKTGDALNVVTAFTAVVPFSSTPPSNTDVPSTSRSS